MDAALTNPALQESAERGLRDSCFARELLRGDSRDSSPCDAQPDPLLGRCSPELAQPFRGLRLSYLHRRMSIENAAAANGGERRSRAQDEVVIGQEHNGLREAEPRQPGFSWSVRGRVVERRRGHAFGGKRVEMHAGSVLQW